MPVPVLITVPAHPVPTVRVRVQRPAAAGADVLRCCDHDNMHSPLVDRIKHNVGLEYEYVLQEMLDNLKVRGLGRTIAPRTCTPRLPRPLHLENTRVHL